MRAIRFSLCALLVLCLVVNAAVASGKYTAQRRQDKNTLTLSNSDSQGGTATAPSDEATKGASPTDSASSSKSSQPDSTTTTTTLIVQTTSSPVSTTLNSPTPSATNGTSLTKSNALPIHPSITPGLSVAGVILLVSGMVYTLIGIKNKWLHIFLSTAFLTGLAVTVLMIYVMNPPIKNGIQGAYVVAAILTGLIFGALSTVFAEVTEGLGCLLGGFCLSMWFLVLKPGGLVTSTVGKVVLIAVFSLTVFALSFSHHTRPYGLIGSISFAGATIVVLGVDCFSRAGLKEFWLYIWGLNDNIFPLNTTSYPHTRGIRVEIAAIVLVSLVGIISQLKLWRVIKERRHHKEEERRQGERDLEALDEDVVRRVEEDNSRERVQWETVYGDREPSKEKKTDSAISGLEVDSRKGSISGVETVDNHGPGEGDQIEMVEMETSGPSNLSKKTQDNREPLVTVRVGFDSGQGRPRAEGDSEPLSPKTGPLSARNSLASRRSAVSPIAGSPTINHDPLQPSVAPPPPVVPLPFTIPAAADSDNEDDDSSVATFADSHRDPVRNTKRSSGISLLMRLSTARNSRALSCDEENLIVPHVEGDRASSVAATIDDRTEGGRSSTDGPQIVVSDDGNGSGVPRDFGLKLDGLSSRPSSGLSPTLLTRPKSIAALPTAQDGKAKNAVHRPCSMIDLRGSHDYSEKKPAAKGITSYWFTRTSIELKAQSRPTKRNDRDLTVKKQTSADSLQTAKNLSSQKLRVSRSPKSISPSVTSGQESLAASLSTQHYPRRVSKVVMSYRTNEWAKHLDVAEKPDLDDLKLADYPEEAQQHEAEEAPRPVNLDELQQTADNAAPPPAPRTTSQTSFAASQPASGHSRSKHNSRVSFTDWQPGQLSQSNSFYQQGITARTTSNHSLQRALSPTASTSNLPQSATSLPQPPMPAHRGLRSASTPLLGQTRVGSPVGEHMDSIEPFGMPTGTTLLDQRQSMVRNKFPSGSSPHLPISPEPAAAMLHDSVSTYNYRLGVLDDDMPLKDRRELIQRQAMMQSQEQLPLVATFDSHQPIRPDSRAQSTDKREAMLASWRESVRHDLVQTQQPKFAVEARRTDMLNDRQQSLLNQRQQAMAANYRDSVLDERMRRGDMLDLHREVLRKMQANANKHV